MNPVQRLQWLDQVNHEKISTAPIKVANFLAIHANKDTSSSYYSLNRIAENTNMSRKSVKNGIKILNERGYITVRLNAMGDNPAKKTNLYTLVFPVGRGTMSSKSKKTYPKYTATSPQGRKGHTFLRGVDLEQSEEYDASPKQGNITKKQPPTPGRFSKELWNSFARRFGINLEYKLAIDWTDAKLSHLLTVAIEKQEGKNIKSLVSLVEYRYRSNSEPTVHLRDIGAWLYPAPKDKICTKCYAKLEPSYAQGTGKKALICHNCKASWPLK